MGNVAFNPDKGVYTTRAGSDSNPFSTYEVTYDPATDEFGCECPAFRFSRDRWCKHVGREGSSLTAFMDDLESKRQRDRNAAVQNPVTPVNTSEEAEYNVVLNGGPEAVMPLAVVNWLLTTIRSSDELVIQRR